MARIIVTTTPTRLDVDPTDNVSGDSAIYRVRSGGPVYIEHTPATATVADGYYIETGEAFGMDVLSGSSEVWAVVASGEADVRVWREGV